MDARPDWGPRSEGLLALGSIVPAYELQLDFLRRLESSLSDASRTWLRQTASVTTIQRTWRGAFIRILIAEKHSFATDIQRTWRGARGRRLVARLHTLRQEARLAAWRGAMAKAIQAVWRGHNSRATRQDFYARKRYLHSLQEEHVRLRARLEEAAALQAAQLETEREASERRALEASLASLHHLVSTASQPGVLHASSRATARARSVTLPRGATVTLPPGRDMEPRVQAAVKTAIVVQQRGGADCAHLSPTTLPSSSSPRWKLTPGVTQATLRGTFDNRNGGTLRPRLAATVAPPGTTTTGSVFGSLHAPSVVTAGTGGSAVSSVIVPSYTQPTAVTLRCGAPYGAVHDSEQRAKRESELRRLSPSPFLAGTTARVFGQPQGGVGVHAGVPYVSPGVRAHTSRDTQDAPASKARRVGEPVFRRTLDANSSVFEDSERAKQVPQPSVADAAPPPAAVGQSPTK